MLMQRILVSVLLIGVNFFGLMPGTMGAQVSPAGGLPIGPESVWHPSDSFLSQHRAEIEKNLIAVMQKGGASAQAIAVARRLKGEQFLNSFKKMGVVDLGSIRLPSANYADTEYVLLNGTPPIIEVFTFPTDKIYGQKLQRDPLFRALLPKYPNLGPMSRHEFVGMQPRPGGGQQFIFSEALQEFRAGPTPARASIAFDFDSQGKFLGASFLKLVRAKE
jgi:hypothetical protein